MARKYKSIVPSHTSDGHRYRREDTGREAWSVTTKLGFVNKGYLHKWYAKKAAEHVRANLPRLLAGDLSVLDEASRAGEDSRDTSASIGTTAHNSIDRYISEWLREGVRPEGFSASFLAQGARGEEIAACRSFDLFINDNEIIPLASELRVWYEHGKDCFAGTVDAIFILRTPHKGRVGGQCEAIAAIGAHDYERQDIGVLWCIECGREVEEKLIIADWKTSNNIKDKDDYAQQDTAYARAVEKAVGCRFDEHWVIRFDKGRAEYEVCKVSNPKQAWKEFLAISRAFDAKESREEEGLLIPLTEKETIQI
jgi:hypothetical protein